MSERLQTHQVDRKTGAAAGNLALDWAELKTVSGRLDGLMARQAAAIGDRYRQLQLEIYAVRQEREAIMSRIFGFVPELVGNA